MAASRSAADSIATIRTFSGTGAVVLPFTSVTSAPRSRAASASAKPIFPLESLVRKRTGSSRSRVAPAVTSTFSPARSFSPARISPIFSTISAGSLIRPAPSSPQARMPVPGPTNRTPRFRRVSTFCRVASAVHMPVFMAGATSTGAFVASTVVLSMSSAMPQAILARIFAVAGAITNTSASLASATCSTFQYSGAEKVSVTTAFALRV